MPTKTCTKCREQKSSDLFYPRKDGKPGKTHSACKSCTNKRAVEWSRAHKGQRLDINRAYRKANAARLNENYKRWRMSRPEAVLICSARTRARDKGLPFGITKKNIVVPTHCPILGIPLVPHTGRHGGENDSPSLDRINPALGYVPGNVMVISHLANMMKSCATPEQLVTFAHYILSNYSERAVA